MDQKRASRGGTQRNTSKGRKKGKASQKSSIGGGSQPFAPEAKHSSDVRIEESKESILSQAIKVAGADLAVMPNDHVNTVNYESEGE